MWAVSVSVWPTWTSLFFQYSGASIFASPITLTKPVIYCSCWVISQISFLMQILWQAQLKKKIFAEFCYNSAYTHLHFHQQWLHLLLISRFWLTHWMFFWKACKSTSMKQNFHKEGLKYNLSSLSRTLKKSNSSPSYIHLLYKELL